MGATRKLCARKNCGIHSQNGTDECDAGGDLIERILYVTLDSAFALPFDGTINIDNKVSHTSSKHHGSFDTTTAQEDNNPDGEIESIVDEPNPPRFSVAHSHKNNATEIDAVGSGI